MTTHSLAKELLEKPDGFITVSVKNEEFAITGFRRKSTCANLDDSTLYWTLELNECKK